MLSNQEVGLTQQALDTSQQLLLASALSWTWNSGRPISDTDWFFRYFVPWRRGQIWSLKHWIFCHLPNWHGW
jgi:hypothetical protein